MAPDRRPSPLAGAAAPRYHTRRMAEHRLTLTQHLLREVEEHRPGGGPIASILAQIATACKQIRAQLLPKKGPVEVPAIEEEGAALQA